MSETPPVAPADPNTGAGLIEFLDAAIEKGWFNVASVKALRTASLKIFEVEGGWESVDLHTLDVDNLFERFRNLKRNAYSDDSMRVYKNRFGQALKMHLARLSGDANWKVYGPTARMSSPSKPPSSGGRAAKRSSSAEVTLIHSGPGTSPEDGEHASAQRGLWQRSADALSIPSAGHRRCLARTPPRCHQGRGRSPVDLHPQPGATGHYNLRA